MGCNKKRTLSVLTLLLIIAAAGCIKYESSIKTRTSLERIQLEQVADVNLFVLPGGSEQPAPLRMTDAKEHQVIAKLVDWLHAATHMDKPMAASDDFTWRPSVQLYFNLNDDTYIVVEPVCGSNPKTGQPDCTNKEGLIAYYLYNTKEALFVKSPELAAWFDHGWRKDVALQSEFFVK